MEMNLGEITRLKKRYGGVRLEDGGLFVSREFKNFQNAFVRVLKAVAEVNEANLVGVLNGGDFVSAFFESKEMHPKYAYVHFNMDGGLIDFSSEKNLLCRSANRVGDYNGGYNRHCSLDELPYEINEMLYGDKYKCNLPKCSFWDLDFSSREEVVRERYNKSKYVVWDYARSIADNTFGMVEALGESINSGCVHGFEIKDSGVVCSQWKKFDVYTDKWYLDEDFENRTMFPYHFFSSYEKALEYSNKVKEYNDKLNNVTLEDILPIIQKYDKSFEILRGKRGYESSEYRAIGNGTCITFTIDGCGNIKMNRGQMFLGFTIPHIDLLDKVLGIYYDDKINDSVRRNSLMGVWAITN